MFQSTFSLKNFFFSEFIDTEPSLIYAQAIIRPTLAFYPHAHCYKDLTLVKAKVLQLSKYVSNSTLRMQWLVSSVSKHDSLLCNVPYMRNNNASLLNTNLYVWNISYVKRCMREIIDMKHK